MLTSAVHNHAYVITSTDGAADGGVALMGGRNKADNSKVNLVLRKVDEDGELAHLVASAQELLVFDHPLVSSLVDLGQVDAQTVFFAHRPTEGVRLHNVLSKPGSLSPETFIGLMHDALRALEQLRRAGLNHNNISLRNIIITPSKKVVLDAPLPRAIDELSPPREFLPLSDLAYLAPERLSEDSDQRRNDIVSDCYAIGACFYRCIIGQGLLPDSGERTDLLRQQITGALNLDLPNVAKQSEYVRKVMRCALHTNRSRRYHIPNDFRHDLNMLIGNREPDRAHEILAFGDKDAEELVAQDGSQALDAGEVQSQLASLQQRQEAQRQAEAARRPMINLKNIAGLSQKMRKLVTISDDRMQAKIRMAPGVIFPEELLRAILQEEGVVFGISDGGILRAATARPRIRKVLLAEGQAPGPGRTGTTVLGEEVAALPDQIIAQLEQEGMLATAEVITGQAIPEQLIRQQLATIGARAGIDEEVITTLSTTGVDSSPVVLARGVEPTPGKAAGFRVTAGDINDCNSMVVVRRGQRFAEWHRPEGGREGYTVTGKGLAFDMPDGLAKELMAGPGTRIEVKNRTNYLTADRDGAVQQSESGILQVSEVLVVRSGLVSGRSPDPLETDAFVLIEGDVGDGCVLKTSGDCVIEGSLGDAEVVIGGDLRVVGDINPGEQEIKVGGALRASNIKRRQITAGSVVVSDVIVDSVVVSIEGVQARCAHGGTLTAADSFTIEEIGDVHGTDTAIWAGYHVPKAIQREMAIMTERRTRHDRDLMIQEREVFSKIIDQIAQKDYMQHVLGYMRQDYKKSMLNRYKQLQIRMEQIGESMHENRLEILDNRERITEANEEVSDDDAEVTIQGTIHPGVTIKIGETATRRIERTQEQAVFKL